MLQVLINQCKLPFHFLSPQTIDILRAFTGNAISITVIRYIYIVFLFLSCCFRFNEIKGIHCTYTLSEKDDFTDIQVKSNAELPR